MTPGEKITKWFQDEGHAYYDELAEKIDNDLLSLRTQYAELERERIAALEKECDLWEKRANNLLDIAKAATAIVENPLRIRDHGNFLISNFEYQELDRAVEACKKASVEEGR